MYIAKLAQLDVEDGCSEVSGMSTATSLGESIPPVPRLTLRCTSRTSLPMSTRSSAWDLAEQLDDVEGIPSDKCLEEALTTLSGSDCLHSSDSAARLMDKIMRLKRRASSKNLNSTGTHGSETVLQMPEDDASHQTTEELLMAKMLRIKAAAVQKQRTAQGSNCDVSEKRSSHGTTASSLSTDSSMA